MSEATLVLYDVYSHKFSLSFSIKYNDSIYYVKTWVQDLHNYEAEEKISLQNQLNHAREKNRNLSVGESNHKYVGIQVAAIMFKETNFSFSRKFFFSSSSIDPLNHWSTKTSNIHFTDIFML